MLKNYFNVAFRNITRHFSYSFINIVGLAIGFASALVIGLWVYQQWSYDRQFEDANRIYRVGVNFLNIGNMAVGPPQLNDYLQNFPEVEETAGLDGPSNLGIVVGNNTFQQKRVYSVDSTFFDVFSYAFEQGNPKTAMDRPFSAVLTQKTAQKLFGGKPALGQTILVGKAKKAYTVTGVVNTQGYRSHINASMWLSYQYEANTNWYSASVYDYVKLKKTASFKKFKAQLNALIEHTIYPSLSVNAPYEQWIKSDNAYRFIVMPIEDIHLKSKLKFEPSPGGSENNVMVFFVISLLIVLIAAVNFINITTARSSVRAKEVGIRKTLGTSRSKLIGQFMFESVLLSLIALVLSFGLAELFLSVFNWFTGIVLLKGLFEYSFTQVLVILSVALVIGFLAGLYPALYLSRFKPIKVLKGKTPLEGGSNGWFRSGMVLFQFTISVCMLISTGTIYRQLSFMRTKDLGLNKENVFIIRNAGLLGAQREAFRQKIEQYSGVESVTFTKRVPASSGTWITSVKTKSMSEELPMQSFPGDYEMIPTFGFRIIKGRNFSKEVSADTQAVILNQSAVKVLRLEKPLGARLNDKYTVIGVVSDFNYESLRKTIKPTILEFTTQGIRMAVRLSGGDKQAFVDYAQKTWEKAGMDDSMNYTFLDQNFMSLLKQDRVLAKAAIVFTFLAILIACLGLYGLSMFITEQKTKEIGVRRVLGATPAQIVLMLNKHFTKPVLLSLLIAVPLAFIVLTSWLNNFAYKAGLSLWIFAGAGLLALGIVWLTVSWQSFRAAMTNPVESLRNE